MNVKDIKPLMKVKIPTTRRGKGKVPELHHELRNIHYEKDYLLVDPHYYTDPGNIGVILDVTGDCKIRSGDSFNDIDLEPYETEIYEIY